MKAWYLSKTLWVNFLTVGTGVLAYLMNDQIITQYPNLVLAIGAVLGLANMVLRLLTNQGITK